MPRCLCSALAAGMVAASLTVPAFADTTLNGSALALRSGGTVSGTSATLSQNGYWGTYVKLDQPGPLTLTASATGAASNGVLPQLTFSIADYDKSFSVAGTNGNYTYTTPTLPAGTYFVRTQLDNHKTVRVNNAPVVANTTLTLGSLTVGGAATVLNNSDDATAIAAANSYINGFRRGDAGVKFVGAKPGASVKITLKNHAFRFGTAVSGGYSNVDNELIANPTAGSDAAMFQEFINGRFNSIVPSNAGKWDPNASVSSTNVSTQKIGMGINDQMMAYAASHGMTARQHNLIWGNQQPTQVRNWLTTATSTTATADQKAAAVANVKTAIANRIAYYISGTNSVNGKTRAANYTDLDVLNEAMQTGNYWNVLGAAGIADVYKQAQAAVAAAGLKTRLYTNEYNVLQNSPITINPSNTFGQQGTATYGDQYANWYRGQVEQINNAAIASGAAGNVVTGVGVQYYPMANGTRGPAVIQRAMQNLSTAGLPISLTEFGGQPTITQTVAPQIVDDAIRMMMGTANVDSFMFWGWYDNNNAATNPYGGGTVMVNKGWKNADGSWNLTPTGKRFEYLFGRGLDPTAPGANPDGSNPNPWTTDLTFPVDANGMVHFNGFYGDYVITIDGKNYDLSLIKGADNSGLTIQVPEPASAAAVGLGVAVLMRRPVAVREVRR